MLNYFEVFLTGEDWPLWHLIHDDLMDEFSLTRQEFYSLWLWVLKFNNFEASLIWLVLQGALWVSKKLCPIGLQCSNMTKTSVCLPFWESWGRDLPFPNWPFSLSINLKLKSACDAPHWNLTRGEWEFCISVKQIVMTYSGNLMLVRCVSLGSYFQQFICIFVMIYTYWNCMYLFLFFICMNIKFKGNFITQSAMRLMNKIHKLN